MTLLSEVVKELLEAEYLELSEASRESLGAVLIKLEFSIQVLSLVVNLQEREDSLTNRRKGFGLLQHIIIN